MADVLLKKSQPAEQKGCFSDFWVARVSNCLSGKNSCPSSIMSENDLLCCGDRQLGNIYNICQEEKEDPECHKEWSGLVMHPGSKIQARRWGAVLTARDLLTPATGRSGQECGSANRVHGMYG